MKFEGVSPIRVALELCVAAVFAVGLVALGLLIIVQGVHGFVSGHRMRPNIGVLPVLAICATILGGYLFNPRRSVLLRALLK